MAADSASSLRKQPPVTVKGVFEHPRYEEVMDSYANCMRWMQGQAYQLRGFVDGSYERSEQRDVELVSVNSPAFNDEAGLALPADVELFNRALKSSVAAQAAWAKLGPHARCMHMYK
ncbi:hypothetical protein V5799_030115 [Amblyomma americanum]|uniref:Uncharacterized protein n=1 Tax=Amblyomma americanum TaxID=6943 RepID=A0AAQ4EPC2_AMBAM